MNSLRDQEIQYRRLNILTEEPKLSQRDLAECVGIRVGKGNYCIAGLTKNGFIKIKRFKNVGNGRPCAYMLTPRSIE